MARYRKKPVVIEAEQWFKNGDHTDDDSVMLKDDDGIEFLSEGHVVRRYRRPSVPDEQGCDECGMVAKAHGWIDTLEGGHIVCPEDWVITGVQGERYPCKPDIFEQTYEKED